jgi:hypothetical protein
MVNCRLDSKEAELGHPGVNITAYMQKRMKMYRIYAVVLVALCQEGD